MILIQSHSVFIPEQNARERCLEIQVYCPSGFCGLPDPPTEILGAGGTLTGLNSGATGTILSWDNANFIAIVHQTVIIDYEVGEDIVEDSFGWAVQSQTEVACP